MPLDVERFLALVCRELGADEARILDSTDLRLDLADARELRWRMPDGRSVLARFSLEPADRDAKQRRLEMLAATFDAVVEEAGPGPRSRPPAGRSLHEELVALCDRAGAINAIVVDANSPIVWGAAHPDGLGEANELKGPSERSERNESGGPRAVGALGANDVEPPEAPSVASPSPAAAASRIAVHIVRTMSDGAASRKGKHVRHVERNGHAPFVAHSFAGIYLLVVVYDAPFDELRAERTIVEALPRVERLVMALPPLDPSPTAGASAVSVRPRRR